MTPIVEMVDITEEVNVARLVGKALRQRLEIGTWRAKPEGFIYIPDVDDKGDPAEYGERVPYWLQEVRESTTRGPVIVDAYGNEWEVYVKPVLPCD